MIELSLKDRTALVTGGSRGIGAAIVRMFVTAGAHVVFNYRQAQADAAAVVREACRRARAGVLRPLRSGARYTSRVRPGDTCGTYKMK